MKKKYLVRIPNNVTILYFPKKYTITFIGIFKIESLKLKVKLFLKKNIILITKKNSYGVSNKNKKTLKAIQKTTIALIKQCMVNATSEIHAKLILVGVGYKVLTLENFDKKNRLFLFKLGYSHWLYFHIPKKINLFCLKFTTLFVYCNSYTCLSKINSIIRSYKKPEPYKGKGILYFDERIILKEGKKI